MSAERFGSGRVSETDTYTCSSDIVQILRQWTDGKSPIDWQAVQQEVLRADAGRELIITNKWRENLTRSPRFVVNTHASADRLIQFWVYSGYRL